MWVNSSITRKLAWWQKVDKNTFYEMIWLPSASSDCRNDKTQNYIILMSLACSESMKFFYASQPKNSKVTTAIRTVVLDTTNIRTAVLDTTNILILWKQEFLKSLSTRFVLMNSIPDLLIILMNSIFDLLIRF